MSEWNHPTILAVAKAHERRRKQRAARGIEDEGDDISREYEIELLHKIADGDEAARDELVESHGRFAIKMARRYRNHHIPAEELVALAMAGLCDATARAWDFSKGCRFLSYARFYCMRRITFYLKAQNRMIRIPYYLEDLIWSIYRHRDRCSVRTGRAPSLEDAAREIGASESLVVSAVQAREMIPLDLAVGGDCGEYGEYGNPDGNEIVGLITSDDPDPGEVMDREECRERLLGVCREVLDDREWRILWAYACRAASGRGAASVEMGRRMKITGSRVRQIRDIAIYKIQRHVCREQILGRDIREALGVGL